MISMPTEQWNGGSGSATKANDEAKLSAALLIAELSDGGYEPIGPVENMREAREFAATDMGSRLCDLDRGGSPACPERYVVWARGLDGAYFIAAHVGL